MSFENPEWDEEYPDESVTAGDDEPLHDDCPHCGTEFQGPRMEEPDFAEYPGGGEY